jgi:hypothetical protein
MKLKIGKIQGERGRERERGKQRKRGRKRGGEGKKEKNNFKHAKAFPRKCSMAPPGYSFCRILNKQLHFN